MSEMLKQSPASTADRDVLSAPKPSPLADHIAQQRPTLLPLWHLCAVRGCLAFVAREGERCGLCNREGP